MKLPGRIAALALVCCALWSALGNAATPGAATNPAARLILTDGQETGVLDGSALAQHASLWQDGAPASKTAAPTAPPDWQPALAQQRQGAFKPTNATTVTLGQNAPPTWLHLAIWNSGSPREVELLVGAPWQDFQHVYLLTPTPQAPQAGPGQWPDPAYLHATAVAQMGDQASSQSARSRLVGSVGWTTRIEIPAGHSEVLVRMQTIEPMVVPVRMYTVEALAAIERSRNMAYGLIYGFLAALMAMSLLIGSVLRERQYLLYAVCLACAIVGNAVYNGHGYLYVWPSAHYWQSFGVAVTSVIYAWALLRFAGLFFGLAEFVPGLWRWGRYFTNAAVATVALALVIPSNLLAISVVFVALAAFTPALLCLALLGAQKQHGAGRLFVSAAVVGMFGGVTTVLTIWGLLPYSTVGYYAFEVGFVIEAMLLAAAVVRRVQQVRQTSERAREQALRDPLTGLYNRRAFFELGWPLWHGTERRGDAMSLLMVDIDHFKRINDTYGHDRGDEVIQAVGHALQLVARAQDLVVRWGGEEFVVLLPGTAPQDAHALAERVRQEVADLKLAGDGGPLQLTISVGACDRGPAHRGLGELITQADAALLQAKQSGRNQVVIAPSD